MFIIQTENTFASKMKTENSFSWNQSEMTYKNWHKSDEPRYASTEEQSQMVVVKEEIDIEEEMIYVDPYESNFLTNIIADEPFSSVTPATTDFERILQAIKEIKLNNETVSTTARLFNIPEANLLYYITEFNAEISEISFLDDEDLLEVVKRIASVPAEHQIFSIKDWDQQEFTTQPEQYKASSRRSSLSSPLSALEPLPSKSKDTTNLSTILQAIKDIKVKGRSVRGTAIKFEIPKTSLMRYVIRFDAEDTDIWSLNDDELLEVIKKITKPQKIFSNDQEKVLVNYVQNCSDRNVKLSPTDLRTLIYRFACDMNVHYPRNWDKDGMAKIAWCSDFRRRHSLVLLNSKQIKEIQKEKVTATPFASSFSSVLSQIAPLREKFSGTTSFNGLQQAIKEIKTNKLSIRAASRIFNIPKTTLSRYLRKFNTEISNSLSINDEEMSKIIKRISQNFSEIFSMDEEEELLHNVKYCLYRSNGKMNISKFRIMAYEFARKRNIEYPLKWDKEKMASRYWYYNFANRHAHMNIKQVNDEVDNEEMKTSNELLQTTMLRKKSRSTLKSKRKQIAALDLKKSKFNTKNILKHEYMTPVLSENKDFCVICMKKLPRKLSLQNSFIYKECNRIVHMKCAKMQKIC